MTYGSNKHQAGIMAVKDMLIQIWNAVVPCLHSGQEGQCPSEAGSKEDVIHTSLGGPVFEVNGSILDCDM